MKIKLDMKQNALHSIHFAIEVIYNFKNISEKDNEFNFLYHDVEKFSPPPAVYNLKFALLHLIQATELILKEYIFNIDSKRIFTSKGNTISLTEALNITTEINPNIFLPEELDFINKAKNLRNCIEHYKFDTSKHELKTFCLDFLALCCYLSEKLLLTNLAEKFDFNFIKEEPNPIIELLADNLSDISEIGKKFISKTGVSWANRNISDQTFLCIFCGEKTASLNKNICMGCIAEGDEEASVLVSELNETTQKYLALKKILDSERK
jgi:hypothetical protein